MVELREDVNKIMKGYSKVLDDPQKQDYDKEKVLLLILHLMMILTLIL